MSTPDQHTRCARCGLHRESAMHFTNCPVLEVRMAAHPFVEPDQHTPQHAGSERETLRERLERISKARPGTLRGADADDQVLVFREVWEQTQRDCAEAAALLAAPSPSEERAEPTCEWSVTGTGPFRCVRKAGHNGLHEVLFGDDEHFGGERAATLEQARVTELLAAFQREFDPITLYSGTQIVGWLARALAPASPSGHNAAKAMTAGHTDGQTSAASPSEPHEDAAAFYAWPADRPAASPSVEPQRPRCTCPPTEAWDPEWDGSAPVDPACPWHGGAALVQPEPQPEEPDLMTGYPGFPGLDKVQERVRMELAEDRADFDQAASLHRRVE